MHLILITNRRKLKEKMWWQWFMHIVLQQADFLFWLLILQSHWTNLLLHYAKVIEHMFYISIELPSSLSCVFLRLLYWSPILTIISGFKYFSFETYVKPGRHRAMKKRSMHEVRIMFCSAFKFSLRRSSFAWIVVYGLDNILLTFSLRLSQYFVFIFRHFFFKVVVRNVRSVERWKNCGA